MAVPAYQTLMLPALALLGRRSPQTAGEVREALAAEFAQMLPSGRQATFGNRVGLICRPSAQHTRQSLF